jgi:hypothetical protein
VLLFYALLAAAHAGPVDIWGFGADHMGRAGGGVALVDRPAGLFLNPAGLIHMDGPILTLGYAVQRTDLRALPDVYWDTNRDGAITPTDEPLSVDAGQLRADGIQMSLGRPVGKRFAVGIAFLIPIDRLLRIHTFEPSLPHYLQYEDSPHRYELTAGFAWMHLPGVSIGGAVQLIAQSRFLVDTTITAPVGLADEGDSELGDLVGAPTLDLHEMTLDLAPSLIPMASIDWDVGEVLPALDGLGLALAYRGSSGLPVDVKVDLQANFEIEETEDLGPLVFSAIAPIELSIFDHYVPERWTLGVSWRAERLRLFGDLHRVGWDKMRLNVATVTGGGLDSQVVNLRDPEWVDGNPYSFEISHTWNVAGGAEWHGREIPLQSKAEYLRVVGRAGVAYAPTPLVSQSGGTALLDSDRVTLAAGLGFQHGDPFDLINGPLRVEVYGQVHPLAKGTLTVPESSPPRAGAPVDGAPLPIGGKLWSVGAEWSVGF